MVTVTDLITERYLGSEGTVMRAQSFIPGYAFRRISTRVRSSALSVPFEKSFT